VEPVRISRLRCQRARKRKPGRPTASAGPGLTRERVVAAALTLVRKEGFEAVNVRRLAADLGVWAGAVSHHAPSKDDLLDDVADILLGACPVAFTARMDWRKRLRLVVRALAQIAADNHGFADWTVTRINLSSPRPNGRAVGLVFREIFLGAGLSNAKAGAAAVAAHASVLGAIKLSDAVRRSVGGQGEKGEGEGGWPLFGAGERALVYTPDQILAASLDHLIAAVEAQLP